MLLEGPKGCNLWGCFQIIWPLFFRGGGTAILTARKWLELHISYLANFYLHQIPTKLLCKFISCFGRYHISFAVNPPCKGTHFWPIFSWWAMIAVVVRVFIITNMTITVVGYKWIYQLILVQVKQLTRLSNVLVETFVFSIVSFNSLEFRNLKQLHISKFHISIHLAINPQILGKADLAWIFQNQLLSV